MPRPRYFPDNPIGIENTEDRRAVAQVSKRDGRRFVTTISQ